jgi:hypothetical protein
MPVRREGKRVVEKATGKTVARSKTVAKAKSAARIRNAAHAAKKRGKKLTVVPGVGFRFDGAKSLKKKKSKKHG